MDGRNIKDYGSLQAIAFLGVWIRQGLNDAISIHAGCRVGSNPPVLHSPPAYQTFFAHKVFLLKLLGNVEGISHHLLLFLTAMCLRAMRCSLGLTPAHDFGFVPKAKKIP